MANIEQFNKIADKYETEQRAGLLALFAKLVASNAVEGNLLDFGCGTGNLGLSLCHQFNEVYLLDPAVAMQTIVCNKIADNSLDNCYVLGDDLERDGMLDYSFNNIVIAQVLLHIPEYQVLLDKLYKCINPGGKIFIFDYYLNSNVSSALVHNGFDIEQLSSCLKGNGFKKITIEAVYEDDSLLLGGYGQLFMLQANKL